MAADSAVLREYLVALGFQVNKAAQKQFSGTLIGLDKTALGLGKTILGVATAAQAMVGVFAVQMEKLYYSSRRAGSTAANMKALEFGARSVGVSGEQMRGSLEGMARAMRSNPGLQGLLNQLGVQVQGRDMSDVLVDMVAQLKKMPFYVAERYANLFGMDSDTLFMLADGLDKLKEAQRIRKAMAKDAGVDTDKAAAAAMEYSNALRSLWERLGLLKDVVAIQLLPGFLSFTKALDDNLASLTRWLGKFDSISSAVSSLFKSKKELEVETALNGGKAKEQAKPKNFLEWMTQPQQLKPIEFKTQPAPGTGTGGKTTFGDVLRSATPDWFWPEGKRPKRGTPMPSTPNAGQNAVGQAPSAPKAPGNTSGAAELFARLERQYALPEGFLDRVWKKESNRGDPRFMESHAGAKGHFQFMDPTAKQYGVKDPYDLEQSATGAAKYLADLKRKYGGNMSMASAAYNWGPGNLDRYGLGRAPAETRDYVKTLTGTTIEQTNHVTVTGVRDPDRAAMAVAEKLKNNNADLVRNMTPRVN